MLSTSLYQPCFNSKILSLQFLLFYSNFLLFCQGSVDPSTLFEGRSENGLYHLKLGRTFQKNTKSFIAFIGIRTTSLVWHFRLGHPSLDIVNCVLKTLLFLFQVSISIKIQFANPVNLAKVNNNLQMSLAVSLSNLWILFILM
jgi:hypothetical protein